MYKVDLTIGNTPLTIGATGLASIIQNIRVIVTTLAYSVPLDRGFAHTGTFIDSPTPYAVALKIAELSEAIEAREPRVKVTSIEFAPRPAEIAEMMQGRVYPKILFRLRDGVKQ